MIDFIKAEMRQDYASASGNSLNWQKSASPAYIGYWRGSQNPGTRPWIA